jgi:DNA-binding protein HU-beta
VTGNELVGAVAARLGGTPAEAARALDAVRAVVVQALTQDGEAELPGLGRLRLQVRRERVGRNPRTGEEIRIEASASVSFQPGRALKEAVAGAAPPGPADEPDADE